MTEDTILAIVGTIVVSAIAQALINKFTSTVSKDDLNEHEIAVDEKLSTHKDDLTKYRLELEDHKTKIWTKANGNADKLTEIELKLIQEVAEIALTNSKEALSLAETYVKKQEIEQHIKLYLLDQKDKLS